MSTPLFPKPELSDSSSNRISSPRVSSHRAAPDFTRVLLVDDQDDVRLMLAILLERKGGYAVETASSGHQAIAKAETFSPHVVISDLTMPGMDGFEMMGELKRKDLAPFKAIALSGYDLTDEANTVAGYDAHLTKPVDFDTLFQTIERLRQNED